MKRFITLLLACALLSPFSAIAWESSKQPDAVDKTVKEVLWEGVCDLDMLHQVRSDLKSAQDDKDIKTLKVTLVSPGGPVVTCLEIARLVRNASDIKKLSVEIHGAGLVASGGTFILASGTPGKRFIASHAFYLVHPAQSGGCIAHKDDAKTVEDKINNAILDVMRDYYMQFSGRPKKEVEEWISCDHERVGDGTLAVSMGLADKTEP